MSDVGRNIRSVFDAGLTWVLLAYGIFTAGVESVWAHDDVRIATGGEAVLMALVGFLWAGRRRSLGWALIVVAASMPLIWLAVAPLFWDGIGEWAQGIPLVYIGGGLALVAVLVALPRRISITRRGVGVFLVILGGGALVVLGLAAELVGGHMSGDEAAVAFVPAAAVFVLGAVMALRRADPRRPATVGTHGTPVAVEAIGADGAGGIDGAVIDAVGGVPTPLTRRPTMDNPGSGGPVGFAG